VSEVINLNKARKARAKAQKGLEAKQNRLLFGLSGGLRKAEMQKRHAEDKRHEGHRLRHETPKPDDDSPR